MQSVQMENPSFLIVWLTIANYLNFNIFMCSITTAQKEWSIKFSCSNSCLPSPFSLTLDLSVLNLAMVDPTFCLRHI